MILKRNEEDKPTEGFSCCLIYLQRHVIIKEESRLVSAWVTCVTRTCPLAVAIATTSSRQRLSEEFQVVNVWLCYVRYFEDAQGVTLCFPNVIDVAKHG